MDERELVRKCQRQDKKAQEILFKRHADSMYRVCYRYVKVQADSEDIMIIAFNKIYKHIPGFVYKGAGSLDAWIKKIMINESLMWLRRRHNFCLAEALDETTHDVGLEQISRLESEDIYQFITALPIGYRTVFNLSVVEGYSHQEIALALNITESTSRTQLFKAKALLKKMLTQEGFHYGT